MHRIFLFMLMNSCCACVADQPSNFASEVSGATFIALHHRCRGRTLILTKSPISFGLHSPSSFTNTVGAAEETCACSADNASCGLRCFLALLSCSAIAVAALDSRDTQPHSTTSCTLIPRVATEPPQTNRPQQSYSATPASRCSQLPEVHALQPPPGDRQAARPAGDRSRRAKDRAVPRSVTNVSCSSTQASRTIPSPMMAAPHPCRREGS